MPSWCDKLAATPTVGVKTEKLYTPTTTTLQVLSPMVSQWVDGERALFSLEQSDAYSVTLSTDSGFIYAFNYETISVDFKHRMRLRAKSAGLPLAEITSKAKPYTELLGEVTDELLKVTELLPSSKTRKTVRIGIVTTAVVDDDAA